jgi:16S rRNA (cytosine967-C5)-methyltransferase
VGAGRRRRHPRPPAEREGRRGRRRPLRRARRQDLQLAASGASVVAVDRSAARLERVTDNFKRMDLAAEVVAADAGAWDDARTFDAVLLDAPARPPAPSAAILTCCGPRAPATWPAWPACRPACSTPPPTLKPGGRLVYCVCSLEPEEGEAQVEAFLARRPDMRLDPIASARAAPRPPA